MRVVFPRFPFVFLLAFACTAGSALLRAQGSTGVTPTLNNTEFNLTTNELVGTFGYVNVNSETTTVPLGGTNFFVPGPINRGQPTSYLSGTHDNAFTVTQSTATFTQMSWTLGLTTVTATKADATAYVPANTTFTQTTTDYAFPVYQGKDSSTYTLTGGSFTAFGAAMLDSGALLHVNGGSFSTPTLAPGSGSTLRVSSGTLSATGVLPNLGTIELRGGTLSTPTLINQAGGTLAVQSGSHGSIGDLTNLGTVTGSGGDLALNSFLNTGTASWQSGALSVPSVTNNGTFTLSGGTVTVATGFTNNSGLRITGGTLVTPSLAATGFLSWTGGTIQLTNGGLATDGSSFLGTNPALAPGQSLQLSGATTIGTGHFVTVSPTAALQTQGGTNSGTLFVTGGTLTSASGTFTNNSGASLYGTAATLTFTGDGVKNGDGLQNRGTLTLVDTIVHGDVNSPAGSNVNVAGNVTFTGLFSGAANFAGSGSTTFAGGYSPGDSPAFVTHAGNLTFDAGNHLTMELGSLERGTGYDALSVDGLLTFGGALDVSFINGFTAEAGNSFDLFDWHNAAGSFNQFNLPTLASGLSWDTSQLYIDGTLSVGLAPIPEPSTYAMLAGLGALGIAFVRRRRK